MFYYDLLSYIAGLFVLVLTPGPVVLAVISRSLSQGYRAVFPIILAVSLGDLLWIILALLGLGALAEAFPDIFLGVRYLGALYLIWIGISEIRVARQPFHAAKLKNKDGFFENFMMGFMLIINNPKAIIFYVSFASQFFDIKSLSSWQMLAIVGVTPIVPFFGNLLWALGADFARTHLVKTQGIKYLHLFSGVIFIVIALGMLFYHAEI